MVDGFDAAFDHFVDINIQKDDLFSVFSQKKNHLNVDLLKLFQAALSSTAVWSTLTFYFLAKTK